jgi:hypothetical protein
VVFFELLDILNLFAQLFDQDFHFDGDFGGL